MKSVDFARLEFEKTLSAFRSNENFRESKIFQDNLDKYHRAIATEFAYDFVGFVDYFFTNSRRNAGFKLLGWYKDKFLTSFQTYLKKTELALLIHDFVTSKDNITSYSNELKIAEDYYQELMSSSEEDFRMFKARKEYGERISEIKSEIRRCNDVRETTFSILCERFSEQDIFNCLEEREELIKFEMRKLESVVTGTSFSDCFILKNKILQEIHERKYGVVVCSGNFFGKSVMLSILSVWALLCHTNMVVRNIVAKSARETVIKQQLLNTIEGLMDGVVLENGVDSGIFHYLFKSNVNEVYKVDIYAKNNKDSASKYSTKWLWYTSYAKDSTDTKGQRNKNFLMIFDEASEIPSETITGAITNINRDFDALNFIVMCGNPNQRAGEGINEFFKYLYTPTKYSMFFDVFRLTEKDLDTSILKSNALIGYLTETEGVDSPVFRERVLGEIVTSDAIFSSREIADAFSVFKEPVSTRELLLFKDCRDIRDGGWAELCDFVYQKEIIVGIDPAGSTGGVDSFGICLRSKEAVGFCVAAHKEDHVYNLIGHIWNACNTAKSVVFAVDINGVGAYFCQVLGLRIGIPENKFIKFFGHNYLDSTHFLEREGFRDNYAIFTNRLCIWLKKGRKLGINEGLKSEMSQMCWANQNNSKKKVNKEEFMKKMRKSPDLFDGLNASFAKDFDRKSCTSIKVQKTSNILGGLV